MIIKPKPRGNGGKLADYLLRSEKNERAELLEMRGFRGTLKGALGREEELAEIKTHCEKPFYHVSFRAAPGEELTPEQWQYCADKLEKRLGLENNHRAIVLQTHEGEQHMHVVWSRIDPETREVVSLYQDWPRCQQVAREIERELGLQKVRDHKREDERELAAPSFGEDQEARRKGQDLKETRAAIREAWEQSADGRSFAAALKERGLEFAQGDRRDFVAVDDRGATHSIGKRTTGATAAEVREKLADLDRERLPTVEKVREQQRELAKERDRENWIERAKAELAKEAERENWIERAKAELAKEAKREQQREAPKREPEREQKREPEPEASPAITREPETLDRGAGRAADAFAGAALNALGGLADFFAGGSTAPEKDRQPEPEPPRKQEEDRPRGFLEELLAEGYAASRAAAERWEMMSEEQRREEERRLEAERKRERDQRGGRERER